MDPSITARKHATRLVLLNAGASADCERRVSRQAAGVSVRGR